MKRRLPVIERREWARGDCQHEIVVAGFCGASSKCRLRTPDSWGSADPRGARWLMSGGDPGVLGLCEPQACTEQRQRGRVRSHEAHVLVVQALEAGLVLHGYDSIDERYVTAGRDIRAVGSSGFSIWEGAEKTFELSSAAETARILIGNRVVSGVLGTYPAWGAAVVALERNR